MNGQKRLLGKTLSVLLVFSLLSLTFIQPAEAGIIDKVVSKVQLGISKVGQGIKWCVNGLNKIVDGGRNIAINTVAIAGGAVLGLAGACIGGLSAGPLGFIAGGVGGYFLGKALVKLLFKSPLPMVAGAIIGGIMVSSLGLPAILLGALVGAAAGHFISTGLIGNDKVFSKSGEGQESKATKFINFIKGKPSTTSTNTDGQIMLRQETPVSTDAQLRARYEEAYKNYTAATQRGDSAEAQKCLAAYQEAAKALKGK